jgi:branched-chain amino acid transport system substrate-binding protein
LTRLRRWPRFRRLRGAGVLAALAVSAGGATVAGCGARATAARPVSGRQLTIYTSLPFDGPSTSSADAVLGGVDLALDAVRHRVGRYRIVLKVLNDATVKARGWDPGQTSANARLAVADRTSIGYVGEFNSGASAISIPLLNRAGIPQVSPASTAVGLTMGGPEALPGEPQKYYPTQVRTFVRVIPSDAVQAAAQAHLQVGAGCRSTIVLDDGEVDGRDGALSFAAAAASAGLKVSDTDQFDPRASSYSSLAASVAGSGADCVLISALPQDHAALVSRQVARALPSAPIFCWSGLADADYTDAADGGVPEWLDPRLLITAPTLDARAYPPAGRRFLARYARLDGSAQPYAIYGYEAMSLMLDAISRATDGGRREILRSKVRAAIFATHDRRSVLGIYSIDADGDTTLRRYGAYRVDDGRLVFWKAVRP